jgi:hypothetical protein
MEMYGPGRPQAIQTTGCLSVAIYSIRILLCL